MNQKIKKSKVKFFKLLKFLLFAKSAKVTRFFRLNKTDLIKILVKYSMQLSFLYICLYILVYFFNYEIFSVSNELLAKSNDGIGYYFNAYPFNVWYLFLMWFFVSLYLFSFILIILTFLSENKKPTKLLFTNIFYSSSFIFSACFPLLVINAIYPINGDTTIASFSFLVSLWILILGCGIIFSAIRFGQIGSSLLGQNLNRAVFTWVLACFSLIYFIYKILA